MDQVKDTGVVNTVSINFCTAPEAHKPEISFFVVMHTNTASNPNTFQIVNQYELKTNTEAIQGKKGIRTFNVGGIPVDKGQYLAIRFAPGSGNPYATERNQYYTYFDDRPYRGQCLQFTRCRTSGIAMSFEVQPSSLK